MSAVLRCTDPSTAKFVQIPARRRGPCARCCAALGLSDSESWKSRNPGRGPPPPPPLLLAPLVVRAQPTQASHFPWILIFRFKCFMRRAEGWGTASALSIHNTTDWTLLVNQGIKQFYIYYAQPWDHLRQQSVFVTPITILEVTAFWRG